MFIIYKVLHKYKWTMGSTSWSINKFIIHGFKFSTWLDILIPTEKRHWLGISLGQIIICEDTKILLYKQQNKVNECDI